MAEALQDYEHRPVGRPTFLTVLCILTFIGSGWGIVNGVIQYVTADSRSAEMAMMKTKASDNIAQKRQKDDAGSRFAEKMVNSMSVMNADSLRKGGMAGILSSAICLLGAFMMWQLRKPGFYLYILGTLVGIVSPFIIFGTNNFLSIMSSIFVGFIGIAFIILYAVNVKHMR